MRARPGLLAAGILSALAGSVSAQTVDVLRNGGFEKEPRVDPGAFIRFSVVDGWASEERLEFYDLDTTAQAPYEGKQCMELDELDAATQYCRVVPGSAYTLKFAVALRPNASEDRVLEVRFDGVLIATLGVLMTNGTTWQPKQYTVVPTTDPCPLEFRDVTGGPRGTRLDGCQLLGPARPADRRGDVLWFTRFDRSSPPLPLASGDMFARSIASLGDLDGDGVTDVAVGAVGNDDGGDANPGAIWTVFLTPEGDVKGAVEITQTKGGLGVDLDSEDGFGRSLCAIGDLDGDGVVDLAVGANYDDDAGTDAGAVYVLFLDPAGTVRGQHKITSTSGLDQFDVPLGPYHEFGSAVAPLGDLDGDGVPDLAVGRRNDDSLSICFLNPDGTVKASTYLRQNVNGLTATGLSGSWLGMSAAPLGDLDGDGVTDLAVGAYGMQSFSEPFVGAMYLLFLNPDGTVDHWTRIGPEDINPTGQYIGAWDELGVSCATVGDVDGDGVVDLAVGAHREGPRFGRNLNEGLERGGFYLLLLNADGTLKGTRKFSESDGSFDYRLQDHERWGESMCSLGDFDGDGMPDLAVGTRFQNLSGGVFLLRLNDGTHVPARAQFTTSVRTGTAPLSVTFTDTSTGEYSQRDWDFGDGTTRRGGSSVTHVYDQAGNYDVRLVVSGSGGIDEELKRNWISVSQPEPPVAGFTSVVRVGFAPFAASFTDQSTGPIDSWSWSFGDGGTSTAPDPVHVYATPGIYSVSLTVSGPGGSNTLTRGSFVVVSEQNDPNVLRYGCGQNPVGSLSVISGTPRLGSMMVLGLDNPLGTQLPGALPKVVLSIAPEGGFPCGRPAIGMGMDGGGGAYLIRLTGPLLQFSGTAWGGPGTPARVNLPIPRVAILAGLQLYAQGVLIDAGGGAVSTGLTDALRLQIAP